MLQSRRAEVLVRHPSDDNEIREFAALAEQSHLRPADSSASHRSPGKVFGETASSVQCWEIIGGTKAGGLVVREGVGTDTKPFVDRLLTGSLVAELALKGQRLQYRLIAGQGPMQGWISTKLKDGKEIAMKRNQEFESPAVDASMSLRFTVFPASLRRESVSTNEGSPVDTSSDSDELAKSERSESPAQSEELESFKYAGWSLRGMSQASLCRSRKSSSSSIGFEGAWEVAEVGSPLDTPTSAEQMSRRTFSGSTATVKSNGTDLVQLHSALAQMEHSEQGEASADIQYANGTQQEKCFVFNHEHTCIFTAGVMIFVSIRTLVMFRQRSMWSSTI
jgi:hypothetical protein